LLCVKAEAAVPSFIIISGRRIRLARKKVAVAVNTAMVETYWHIGRIIIEEEQEGK
jgi:hypothetical protein